LSRDFQLLAEASPDEFRSALDDSLDNEAPPIAALFGADESPIFGGAEHLSDLLWALESLAWSPQLLLHVSLVLARLDQIDPGNSRYLNRPAASLRTAFLLWSPQTNATFSQRLKVLDRIRKRYSNPAWKLMLGILPTGHDSFSPAASTRWRDFSTDKTEVVTYQLICKGAEALLDRLLEDVGSNAPRWVTMLDRWSDLGDRRQKAAKQLEQVAQGNLSKGDRELLRTKLRGVLHHQRSFPNADWGLPKEDIADLQVIYDALAPLDPIESIAWLFETSVSLPNPIGDWRKDQQQLQSARATAVEKFLRDNGTEKLFELIDVVREPSFLGQSIAEATLPEKTRKELLVRALRSERDTHQAFARGLVWAWHRAASREWSESLFDEALQGAWGDKALLTILLALPATGWVWAMTRQAGEAVEASYWKRFPILWGKEDDADPVYAIEKLIAVGRARDSIHFIGYHLHDGRKFASDLLAKALIEAVRQPVEGEPGMNDRTMFQHYAQEIFKQLDNADDVSTETLARLEWQYLPMFEHSERKAKAIMSELATKPDLFVQLLAAVYKPSEDSGVVDPPAENPEHARNIANQAYRLLRIWNVIPGTGADGSIDGARLEAWVKEARKLAHAIGRGAIADQKIGEMLSASKVDDDGIWPVVPVREVIEAIRSRDLETGVAIGKSNRRGVTTRAYGDGGDLERKEAKRYRDWSEAAALDWPRTSGILENLAKNYDHQAKAHDEDAERVDWR
jgi:uncharacterized membrane-anchored protein YhcB (DUF1043 family)